MAAQERGASKAAARNHTILELKHLSTCPEVEAPISRNHTILELKRYNENGCSVSITTRNHTILELKLHKAANLGAGVLS